MQVQILILTIIIAIGISILLLVFQLFTGKDKRPEVIKVEYALPKEIKPGIAGVLVDENADVVDVIATLFDLERRGYVEIEPKDVGRYFLDKKVREIVIKPIAQGLAGLSEYEAELMDILINLAHIYGYVSLRDLGTRFAREINEVRRKIEDEAARLGYFEEPPYAVRNFFTGFYLVLLLLGGFIIWKFSPPIDLNSAPFLKTRYGVIILFILFLLTVFPIGVLTYPIYSKIKRSVALRTKKGVEAWGRVLGLYEFIKRVERDRIRRMAEKDPEVFKKLLPFAMIFGLAKEWAEKFEKEYMEFPEWYQMLNDAEKKAVLEFIGGLMTSRRRRHLFG